MDAVRRLPLWTPHTTVDSLAAMMGVGVPGDQAIEMKVSLEGSDIHFEIDSDVCELKKRIVATERGFDVVFDLYGIPEHMQDTGHAKRMFRTILHAYADLGFNFVVTANEKIGGYTWGRLAGRAVDYNKERGLLLDRLQTVAKREKFSTTDARALEKLIEDTPNERLMYDVARCESPSGRRLGKPLLIGHRWDAFWDLQDPQHQAMIAEALA